MRTTTLLLLGSLLSATSAVELPTNPSEKYWPNGRPADLGRRSENRQSIPQILGVKKITSDDEKFYPSHYITGQTITDFFGSEINVTDAQIPLLLRPAARTHKTALTPDSVLRLFKRQNSDFNCPDNHYKCLSINRPNFCCGENEKCEIIRDSGIGDVGCCPQGQNCLGTVTDCGDNTACTTEQGGGCCVQGYRCTINGCIPIGSPTTTTTANPTQTSACEEGFYACPASLGGGCCRVGRACGINDCPAEGDNSTPTPTDGAGAGDNSNCPSGYFACGSEFSGGCCRIGRACAVSSCPVATGTNVPGIVVGGTCADGWYGCSADKLGGCCPDGYDCGMLDCPAKGANTPAAVKQNVIPGAGARAGISLAAVVAGAVAGVAVILA